MAAKVQVRNLRKRYGPVEAVRGVTFDIQDGEIFGLLGPNGAGKTTTLECVIGLREPDGGTIEVCGIDARARPRDVKQRIGAALQSTALQDKITPREALVLFGSFYAQRAAPETLLERFSLREKADATFDTLSGGQRQRLALALAFVNKPDLVFLDEPTSGLDPQARRELHGEIIKMRDDGHTVLLTTHYMDEAQTLCDRIAIVNHGEVIASGTPEALTSRSSSRQLVTVVASRPLAAATFETLGDVDDLVVDGERARFHAAAPTRTVPLLLARLEQRGIELVELHVQKATLEDVFIELTAAERSE
ncbi:MAG: ABC transporter ATP-binding protein [Acidobacteriota bacterium]